MVVVGEKRWRTASGCRTLHYFVFRADLCLVLAMNAQHKKHGSHFVRDAPLRPARAKASLSPPDGRRSVLDASCSSAI